MRKTLIDSGKFGHVHDSLYKNKMSDRVCNFAFYEKYKVLKHYGIYKRIVFETKRVYAAN